MKQIDAPVIMGIVTIFAILSWWFAPEDAWLSKQHITQILEVPGEGQIDSSVKPHEG